MIDTVWINAGSDLRLSGVLSDESGPIDLTGMTVSVFDGDPILGVSVSITDAAQGKIAIAADWQNAWSTAPDMRFRVQVDEGGAQHDVAVNLGEG